MDKLTKKNYKTWKTRMELLLDVEELLDITTGASPKPKKRESNEWNEWRNLDKRARLEIILNVDEKQSEIT